MKNLSVEYVDDEKKKKSEREREIGTVVITYLKQTNPIELNIDMLMDDKRLNVG